jgi:hypothetical protein
VWSRYDAFAGSLNGSEFTESHLGSSGWILPHQVDLLPTNGANVFCQGANPCGMTFLSRQQPTRLSGSRYAWNVMGPHLKVPPGRTWDIGNVLLNFPGSARFYAYGGLNANGATLTGSSWSGVYYAAGMQGTLTNTTVENVHGYGASAVYVNDATLTLRGTTIQGLSPSGVVSALTVTGYNAYAELDDVTITQQSNADGIVYTGGAHGYVFSSTLTMLSGSSSSAVVGGYLANLWLATSPYGGDGNNLITGGAYVLNAGGSSYITARRNTLSGSNGVPAQLNGDGSARVWAENQCYPNGFGPTPLPYGVYASHSAAACGGAGRALLAEDPFAAATSASISAAADAQAVRTPETEAEVYALYHAERKAPSDATLRLVEALVTPGGPLRGAAFEVLIALRARRGQTEAALATARTLARLYPGTAREVRARLFEARMLASKRPAEAASALGQAESALARIGQREREQLHVEYAAVRAVVEAEQAAASRLAAPAFTRASQPNRDLTGASFDVEAYPNPARERATLRFRLEQAAHVRAEVFDAMGRRVAVLVDEARSAGVHTTLFEAGSLPAGLYLWRVTAGSRVQSGTLALIR